MTVLDEVTFILEQLLAAYSSQGAVAPPVGQVCNECLTLLGFVDSWMLTTPTLPRLIRDT